MKTLKEIGMILLCIFIFYYFGMLVINGFLHYNKWLFPLLSTFLYFVPFAFIWLTYRVYKSIIVLFILSWAIALTLAGNAINAAKSGDQTVRMHGYDLYIDGAVTKLGFLYELLINPIGFLAIFSTFLLVQNIYKLIERRNYE